MKRLAVLASIVVAGLTAAGLSAQGQPPLADIEQVSDTVWRIFGAGGTTTVFVRSDGVALVDTKLASNGAAILAQVRKVTDKPVTLIVNTHSHGAAAAGGGSSALHVVRRPGPRRGHSRSARAPRANSAVPPGGRARRCLRDPRRSRARCPAGRVRGGS
jgi:glyoxylase-like metal-dependent hydrolase (beta-lactamase superfamily II)